MPIAIENAAHAVDRVSSSRCGRERARSDDQEIEGQ